jgi:protein-arginine kinase activator protein McsA
VRVRRWRELLRAAVAAEDYEEAARLRDLIRSCE